MLLLIPDKQVCFYGKNNTKSCCFSIRECNRNIYYCKQVF